ncbi:MULTISPECIES: Hsp70 family protein [unclassified Corynebacterium]|uniref:Hsp70 family protein n=1 Tax=unclassified Corynebacterium TaxID=2624378 RepID=UPI0030B0DC7D
MRDWTLGIDFGTSNTAAAHTGPIKDSIETINLSHNRTTMSSSVYVESPDQIDVGDVAINKAEENPAGFVPAPKRVIAQQMINVNGYDLPASVPVAAVLQSVLARAKKEHGNVDPSELVLTHPEAWSPQEIQVLLDAASKLGLDPSKIQTVSEPRAAAHYYSKARALAPGSKIAVFDFGGGTLDVAVLEANDQDTFDVVAARGDNTLGGKNFDALIRRWIDQQLNERNPELLRYMRIQAPLYEKHALEDSIRRAKELLSEAASATISVTGGGMTERFQLTRDEFEELIQPGLDKALQLTRATLADARINGPEDLEALYLTGGSSRIPLVHESLKALGPVATLDDPKTVVAQGALSAAAPIVRGLGAQQHAQQSTNEGWGTSSYGNSPYSAGSFNNDPAPTTPDTTRPGFSVPTSSSSESATKKGGSKLPLIAGAVVGVIVLFAGVAYAMGAFGGDDTPAGNEGGEDTTTAAPTSEAPKVDDLKTVDGVLAAVPEELSSKLKDCEITGQTQGGNLQLRCNVKQEAGSAGLFDSEYASVMISVDDVEAGTEFLRIKENWHNDSLSPNNEIRVSPDGTASAHLSGPSSIGERYTMYYANSTTGVMVNTYDLKGLDDGETFLREAGLF